MDTSQEKIVYWPCDYCKKKFKDVKSVIDHELYLCIKNPKFQYTSENLETIIKETTKNKK